MNAMSFSAGDHWWTGIGQKMLPRGPRIYDAAGDRQISARTKNISAIIAQTQPILLLERGRQWWTIFPLAANRDAIRGAVASHFNATDSLVGAKVRSACAKGRCVLSDSSAADWLS
jgi:hypothetical protein